MFARIKSLITVILFLLAAYWLWESGTVQNLIDTLARPRETVDSSAQTPAESPAAKSIRALLQEQQELIEEIEFARSSKNRGAVTTAYKKILQLEQSYQAQFEELEAAMSPAEIRDIANSHRRIIKSLPRYSDIMAGM